MILFCIAEISIRTRDVFKGYGFFSNDHRDKLASSRTRIIPYRIFGHNLYVEKNNVKYIVSRHNELYPLEKSKETYRIVCLGGSTTEDEWTYNKNRTHYPLVLQHLLSAKYPSKKIEVINLGFGGYATTHMLTLLEFDVISWIPDLVIISENTNDLTSSLFPGFAFDYSNKYGTTYYTDRNFIKYYTTINALLRWSSFYWFIREKWDNIFDKPQIAPQKTRSFGNEPPQTSQIIFRRNLMNFFFIASNWGIPLIYGTQPINPNEKSSVYIVVKHDIVWPLDHEVVLQHKFFNGIIKQVAALTKSYFVDSDSSLLGNPKYFIDEVHYSIEGTEKVAKTYYDFIVSNNIIK